jgi:hypothetical protein
MTPTELIKTANTSSNIWIIVGSGVPDGNAAPQNAAAKGSLYIRDDATDDQPAIYLKVDDDNANDDWVAILIDKTEVATTFEENITLTVDKRLNFRDTDVTMYSNAACKLLVNAPSGVDIDKMTVGSGTMMDSFLAGSGSVIFGALAASAASSACATVTGLTQEHKCFFSPSGFSGCLSLTDFSCSPGGGLLNVAVVNSASEAYSGGTETFSYLAIAACV